MEITSMKPSSNARGLAQGLHGRVLGAVALCGAFLTTPVWADSQQQWGHLSDVLALALPAGAAAYSAHEGDPDGLKQLGFSLAGSYGLTAVIKSQHKAMRPDGSGDDSFPSGHTAIAFAAASYFDKRYGDTGYSGYVYAAAGLTAVARVEARKHYWKDVLAGGALGYGMSQLLTRSRSMTVAVWPTQGGLALAAMKVW
jgi:membrane-associated phospholipid phosphatase